MVHQHLRPAALISSFVLLLAACGSGDAADDAAGGADPAETPTESFTEAAEGEAGDEDGAESPGGLSSSSGGADETATAGTGGSGEMTSEVAAQASQTLEDALPPEAEACVLAALADDPDLLADVLVASDFVELSEEDQATVVKLSLDCSEPGAMAAFMVESFNEGSDLEAPAEMGDCLENRMTGPDGEEVILGFIAVGQDMAPSAAARQPLIDTLTECLPGSLFSSVIVQGLAEDPSLAGAVDTACVESGYGTPGAMQSFWTSFVDNPGAAFEELPAEVQADVLDPLIDCISFGAVLAAEAEASGVTLSADTIACIDAEIAASGLMATLLAGGEPDEAALTNSLLGCLSAEELAGLAGS